jgi:hypothetical protein
MDYENGRREIAGKACGEAYHGLDASGGESNYYYITTRHGGAFRGTNIKTAPSARMN